MQLSINNQNYSSRQVNYIKPKKRDNISPAKFSTITFTGKNENPRQVAFISFETVPINKTGGMSDVVGELAPELNKQGFDVRTIIPLLNSPNGIRKNSDGRLIYLTPKGKEFLIRDLGLEFDYQYGTGKGHGRICKIDDSRVKYPVYLAYCPDDVSNNKTEYQGWIMDQVRNQEAFCKASIEALKLLNNDEEDFNPKYVMSYEWTTAPIIEMMSNDEYYKDKIKIANINNFGPVYQGRVGAPTVAPYLLTPEELKSHCEEERVQKLLEEIDKAVSARAALRDDLSITEEIQSKNYYDAYLKIAKNYEKYIPYTTNHLGFLDNLLLDSFPDKGWFGSYYNFYVPAVRKADSLVSCSDTYMRELAEHDEYSDGLANIMNLERLKSYGITIAMDYSMYNPAATENETTKPIKYPFSVSETELAQKPDVLSYREGKVKNKEYLQEILGKDNQSVDGTINPHVGAKQYGYLDKNPNAMLSCFITRFDPQQKGIDIAMNSIRMLLENNYDCQVIFAGPDFSPENALIRDFIRDVVEKYPGRAVVGDGFINNIAQFYAGSDTVLIPSRFAPFELVQLQGMRMGAVPIASNCGGLAEVIIDNSQNDALGFKTKESLLLSDNPDVDYFETLKRAADTFKDNPQRWNTLIENGMRYKRTWDIPARQYAEKVFNPLNYSYISDLYYLDPRFSAGAITTGNNARQTHDIEFLKHKGFTKILQIDEFDENIQKKALAHGLKYECIPLGDTPTEKSTANLLKEIMTSEDRIFINEVPNKNNKSVLGMFYLAFTTLEPLNRIMQRIWTEREKDFDDVIWGDRGKIRDIMCKLAILGEATDRNLNALTAECIRGCGTDMVTAFKRRLKEKADMFKKLRITKQCVISGKHYI